MMKEDVTCSPKDQVMTGSDGGTPWITRRQTTVETQTVGGNGTISRLQLGGVVRSITRTT